MNDGLTTDPVGRVPAFLEGWKARSKAPNMSGLAAAHRLIEGWRALSASAPAFAQTPPTISLVAVRRVLDGLRGPLDRARGRGEFIDIWSVAGLGRREVPNAAVLAWLINPRGSHGQGSHCLAALMGQVARKAPEWSVPTELLRSARVEAEQRPLGSDRDRVDIVVEAPGLIVFVEVKIDAGEGEAQLSRYTESARRVAAVRAAPGVTPGTPLVLFLSPRPPAEQVANLVHLTWRDVAAALAEAARSAPDPARLIIRSFAKHARAFG